MKTSAAGLEFIARWEGEVLHVYKDSAGIPTIGVGHRLHPGEYYVDGIDHEEALELLSHDVSIAEMAVNQYVNDVDNVLNQPQFDACVSLAFNIGGYAFGKDSSVCKDINRGEFGAAAESFALWNKRRDPVTGHLVIDRGLVARRKAEAELFASQSDEAQGGDSR